MPLQAVTIVAAGLQGCLTTKVKYQACKWAILTILIAGNIVRKKIVVTGARGGGCVTYYPLHFNTVSTVRPSIDKSVFNQVDGLLMESEYA